MINLDWLKRDYDKIKTDHDDTSKILKGEGKNYKIIQTLEYRAKKGIERIDGLTGRFYNYIDSDEKDDEKKFSDICTILDYNLSYENGILESHIADFETKSPRNVPLKGIGRFLFQYMMETILAAHEFLKNEDKYVKEINIKGCLSSADKSNGNWRVSVPFYQHRAEKYKMDFKLSSADNPDWKPEEFIEKSDKDGKFIMTFSEETEPLIIKFSVEEGTTET